MSLITVSSAFGSGGEKIAKKISEQLGIEFFDDSKLQERALAIGVSSKDLEDINEKEPRLFDRLFTNKPAIYLELLGAVIHDIASDGEGVIVGHGAQAFLKDFNCALHILIYAPAETRGEWISKEQNIDRKAALEIVNNMDKSRQEFIRYAFKRNWEEPSGYDLVINLEKIGAEWAEKLIIDLAGSEEIKECSLNALEKMELSSLNHKIEATLIRNNLASIYSGVIVDITGRGKVHLRGHLFSKEEHGNLVKLIEGVPGVTEVTSDVAVVPSAYGY